MENASTPNPEDVVLEEGTPEYDAAMVQKFEDNDAGVQTEQTGTQEEPTGEDRPEWLPEKFNNPEDLAKAYAELERRQSQGAEENPAEDEAKAAVTAAGLDFDALSTKFNTTGALEDTDYTALETAGIPRSLVDSYIAGQMAVAERIQTELVGVAGGQESYAQMVEWAGANLPPEDIAAFNSVLDRGDTGAMKLAIAGLKSKYDAEVGVEPSLLDGDSGQNSADAFQSTAQLTAAMRDPRYNKDPAYRREVEQKLARSSIF